ncbi:hypothetical protein JW707_04040 [Candidatus Woesearchaeota archaeon]|nr:hypothetical protein [Candidatus Woesearchaeota archaeon]
MKKASATPIILSLLAIVALAAVTIFFKVSLTGAVVAEPEQEPAEAVIDIDSAECFDSDGGFNLFESGNGILVIDGSEKIEMKDRCLFEEYGIAETVCRGDEVKQVKGYCPLIEFPDGARQSDCIEDSEGARCKNCADYGLIDCDGKCC